MIDSEKIGIVSMYNESYKSLADVTLPIIQEYANAHNYKFFYKNSDFSKDYFIYFEKPKIILDTLLNNSIEWIWWIDIDAIITNHNIKLQSIIDDRYDIIISTDGAGINCGSFLVKNSNKGRAWLEMIYSHRFVPKYTNNKWPEQLVIHDTAKNYTDILKIVPQKTLNSYYLQAYEGIAEVEKFDRLNTSCNWTPGDFVIHMPGVHNILRIEFFKIFAEKLVMKFVK